MSQVDYAELLRSEFEEQNTRKCTGVALRAALRDFPPPNFDGNTDVSDRFLFPNGRLLLQSIVHWKFQCPESFSALRQTWSQVHPDDVLLSDSTSFLAAQASHLQEIGSAQKAVDGVIASFATATNQHQFLTATSADHWRTPQAYFEAEELILKECLKDFGLVDANLFNSELWSNKPTIVPSVEDKRNFRGFFQESSYSFWRLWRQRFIDGNPLDWDFQRQIALIEDEIWREGPGAFAAEVARIEKRQEIRRSLHDPAGASRSRTTEITQSIMLNRDALAVSIAGLIEQIDSFREQIRGSNTLDADLRAEILEFADYLITKFSELSAALPAPNGEPSKADGGGIAVWLRDYKDELLSKLTHYSSPDNVAGATVPTSIVLGTTGIGAMLGQPVAGAVVGGLITNQMKPSQAAKQLLKRPEVEDLGTKQ